MSRAILLFLVITTYLFISFQMVTKRSGDLGIGSANTIDNYKVNATAFAAGTVRLEEAIKNLSGNPAARLLAIKELTDCRLRYKKIEFFTSYFFNSETRLINAAPVIEVEEPTLEYVESMGLQQMEALLFDENYPEHKPELLLQAEVLRNTASQLQTLLYNFQLTDAQILESLRIDLIRVITLSLSGYDAPELKTGIKEATASLKTMQEMLIPYIIAKPGKASQVLANDLEETILFLSENQDFDSFDRLRFLTRFALPLQSDYSAAVSAWDLKLNTEKHLNYEVAHLFSRGAVQMKETSQPAETEILKISLGEKLFTSNSLSGNGQRSCATCHQPGMFFNDNLTKSPSVASGSILKRNTPSLLYASAQHMQFWDGRAATLEDQIVNVIFNPLEMDGDPKRIDSEILKNDRFLELFSNAFPEIDGQTYTVKEIAGAITAYIGTLQPLSSPFDAYVNGQMTALTDRQINGFNLFMGKAQCGTCHFLPYFNSLLPPHYAVSEIEILGTPGSADLDKPVADADRGRYDLYPVPYYDGAFKTPTVRNAAKTAPYMHNGSLNTLQEVVEFYNRGGGEGIGLKIAGQTLSSKPLKLTPTEIEDICLFMESLTDKI
jgi:cytochrome c peroxidase